MTTTGCSRDNFNDAPQNRSRRGDVQQSQLSNTEFAARQEGFQRLVDSNRKSGTLSILGDMRVGEMTPLWLEGEERANG